MIEITVKLDEKDVEAACAKAWAEAFAGPGYNSRSGGPGYERVRQQVIDHALGLDLSVQIARVAERKLALVVEEVVSDMLRESVRKRAKQMRAEGQLALPT
ncbi:hypothetical protein [Thermomonas mangrovi]|uniref:hypothetical protein n=1 Tax=Thermomonas mangrovi TaxID=2993316 RepID=UPI002307B7EA|nr:hypothetical protein [Thermomonas mangrovi]